MEIWKIIGSSAVHLTAKVQPFTVSSFCIISWWWWVCGVRDLGTISASMGEQKGTMSVNSHSWPADATATGAAFPPGAGACTAHWAWGGAPATSPTATSMPAPPLPSWLPELPQQPGAQRLGWQSWPSMLPTLQRVPSSGACMYPACTLPLSHPHSPPATCIIFLIVTSFWWIDPPSSLYNDPLCFWLSFWFKVSFVCYNSPWCLSVSTCVEYLFPSLHLVPLCVLKADVSFLLSARSSVLYFYSLNHVRLLTEKFNPFTSIVIMK